MKNQGKGNAFAHDLCCKEIKTAAEKSTAVEVNGNLKANSRSCPPAAYFGGWTIAQGLGLGLKIMHLLGQSLK